MPMMIRETVVRDGAVIERYLSDMDGGSHYKVCRMTMDGKDIPVGSIDVVLPHDVNWARSDVLVPYAFILKMRDMARAEKAMARKPKIEDSEFYEHEGRYALLRDLLAEIGHPNGGAV